MTTNTTNRKQIHVNMKETHYSSLEWLRSVLGRSNREVVGEAVAIYHMLVRLAAQYDGEFVTVGDLLDTSTLKLKSDSLEVIMNNYRVSAESPASSVSETEVPAIDEEQLKIQKVFSVVFDGWDYDLIKQRNKLLEDTQRLNTAVKEGDFAPIGTILQQLNAMANLLETMDVMIREIFIRKIEEKYKIALYPDPTRRLTPNAAPHTFQNPGMMPGRPW